jgi:hypothetical protein
MASDAEVLVLGGGLSGCLVAAGLADSGLDVIIVEQQAQLMSGASRWNDGKIHLGYTFTGTSSVATALLMQEGCAEFFEGLERTLGGSLPPSCITSGVIYLVDEASMVDAETLWTRATHVSRLHDELATRHAGMRRYLEGQSPLERLDPAQATDETGQTGLVAAWRTPERHVSARAVADRLARSIHEREIGVVRARVIGARRSGTDWIISLSDGRRVQAPLVVNCLWENRQAIDRQLQPTSEPVSIRFKQAVFGRSSWALSAWTSSTRILGPFGDVVSFANGDVYLSWYPAGLIARSDDGSPPDLPEDDPERLTAATLAGLRLSPTVLDEPDAEWCVRGGYIVAWGYGDIDQPTSPLHERHRPGIQEIRPGFYSIDTGKYTLGPLLGARAVARVLGEYAPVKMSRRAPRDVA